MNFEDFIDLEEQIGHPDEELPIVIFTIAHGQAEIVEILNEGDINDYWTEDCFFSEYIKEYIFDRHPAGLYKAVFDGKCTYDSGTGDYDMEIWYNDLQVFDLRTGKWELY